jgi:hypothetical protein
MIPATQKTEVEWSQSETSLGKKHENLPDKQTTSERARSMTWVVEHSPSKCEASSSIPSTTTTKKKKKKSD